MVLGLTKSFFVTDFKPQYSGRRKRSESVAPLVSAQGGRNSNTIYVLNVAIFSGATLSDLFLRPEYLIVKLPLFCIYMHILPSIFEHFNFIV